MKQPSKYPAEALAKAADEMAAWRAQQIVALTPQQVRIYNQAKKKADEAIKAKAKQLDDQRSSDIRERMRKHLLGKAEFRFDTPRKGQTPLQIHARQEIEKFFEGVPPATKMLTDEINRCKHRAEGEIDHEHALEFAKESKNSRDKLDALLQGFEAARNSDKNHGQDFARAGADSKAKAAFEKGTSDQAQESEHSPALKRAIERAQLQEEARQNFTKNHGKDDKGHTRK